MQIQKTDQLHAGESKCSLLMRLNESCGFSEESVKISDDRCLSPGNSVQQSVREGWSSQVHLQQVDDPGGLLSMTSNWLQDPATGHHLPSDGVHTGTRQRLLEHRLHCQHAQATLFGLSADAAEVPRLAEVAGGRIC